MSNYPNMSYCAFENTLQAVDQLCGMLEEALENEESLDLNRFEQGAFSELQESAATLLKLMMKYDAMAERFPVEEVEEDA